jgi:hypothetical protein
MSRRLTQLESHPSRSITSPDLVSTHAARTSFVDVLSPVVGDGIGEGRVVELDREDHLDGDGVM